MTMRAIFQLRIGVFRRLLDTSLCYFPILGKARPRGGMNYRYCLYTQFLILSNILDTYP